MPCEVFQHAGTLLVHTSLSKHASLFLLEEHELDGIAQCVPLVQYLDSRPIMHAAS